MRKLLLLTAIVTLILTGCKSKQQEKVEYVNASGYFVRNDIADGTIIQKITSQEQLDGYFGMGATMSVRPTAFDFTKEYAIAVILPLTENSSTINIDSLLRGNGKVNLYYSVQTGSPQTYTSRPFTLLVIDRKYDGELDVTANK
ncbi:MAG: hypothetical protein LBV74_15085 [Tannerella sp.]|jgi:hypothetical protein|nr:hypothetical protein [Tannerella sp.]